MPQQITKGYRAIVDSAMREVETLPIDQAVALANRDDVVLVDIRDIRELQRDGVVPGAIHAPRGMLEFWIDPGSPYHKPVFAQDMGLKPVAHVEGGFGAWKKAGGPVADYVAKKKA